MNCLVDEFPEMEECVPLGGFVFKAIRFVLADVNTSVSMQAQRFEGGRNEEATGIAGFASSGVSIELH